MMAKYSMKMGGKEVGSAAVYAEPHTMDGAKVVAYPQPGKQMPYNMVKDGQPTAGVAMNPNSQVKTTGIKMRGAGAATKGVMCRGPMA